jgi:dTDP-4-dehydrorhamnose 3,5-epimerase
MEIEKLAIEGLWIGRSPILSDPRGFFREWFKSDDIGSEIGRKFEVSQSNISMSNCGVLRGIHYSLAPTGQAKWITCISGSIWDVAVDIRPSSPTYRKWIGVTLTAGSGEALFLSEGLGHAFISLEDNSMVSYLLNSPYSPSEEFEINPLDPELSIRWPGVDLLMSSKDEHAPTLAMRYSEGKLPGMDQVSSPSVR